MFTDIVGYTSMTQNNESLALKLLEKHREFLRPILVRYGGHEVKTMGDAFLVEFPSALQATESAVEIQKVLHEYNQTAPERLLVRVGIHIGDVIHSQGDVYGDAVNIASRIEPLAEGGGVCISEQVYAQVRNKIPYNLVKLETKELKNVSIAMDVYKLELPWEQFELEPKRDFDKRRLAVLPFTNISPDPSDEYFADGMTEELIDRLSQVRGLRVIARTSVMSYKKKEKKVSDIGKELGVGTLVEGSVRKAGNKIRVTVQLIDVSTEEHLWSSRYDKDLDDIFAVQSEIASRITEVLPSSIIGERSLGLGEGGTRNVVAYAYFLQGRQLLYQGTGTSLRQALDLFEKAATLDSSFARAYASMAACHIRLGYASLLSADEATRNAKLAVQKALNIDENLAEAHVVLSEIAWMEDDRVKDEAEARKAIELNPSLADAYAMLATVKATNGYPNEAIRLYEAANQLDPLSPRIIGILGTMYFYRGREKEAEEHWNRNLRFAANEVLIGIGISRLSKGNYEEAEQTIESLERDFPEDLRTVALRGYLAALRGDNMVAEKTIMRLEEKFKGGATVNTVIGSIRYFMGNMDAFFAAMFRDVESHSLNPFFLRYSPLFEKARQDPRYREVMIKNGLDPELKE
jgi:TolB-like protein/tetratricopeptide (TPR) repeat protein